MAHNLFLKMNFCFVSVERGATKICARKYHRISFGAEVSVAPLGPVTIYATILLVLLKDLSALIDNAVGNYVQNW
jgi:hypothetical protein